MVLVTGGRSDLVVSDGMVLGLRLPGALERFPQLLAEDTRHVVSGDVIVLYTDGAIDARRPDGERFSTEGLAKSLFGRFENADAMIVATVASATSG